MDTVFSWDTFLLEFYKNTEQPVKVFLTELVCTCVLLLIEGMEDRNVQFLHVESEVHALTSYLSLSLLRCASREKEEGKPSGDPPGEEERTPDQAGYSAWAGGPFRLAFFH